MNSHYFRRRSLQFSRSVFGWISSKIGLKSKNYESKGREQLNKNVPEIMAINHNCSLIALHLILPEIPESKLLDAFYNCCRKWPNGGVSNKELNIVIKFLRIGNLVYFDKETTLKSLLEKNGRFIALVHGHFLAISGKVILEYFDPSWNCHTGAMVYCYWEHTGR